MAEYAAVYAEFRRTGTQVAAISVDPPAASEMVRAQLEIPFPLLCDTERRVVQEWGVFNERERGGIARPAVFLVGQDRRVILRSLDSVNHRVPAAALLELLRSAPAGAELRRKTYRPRPGDWWRAVANDFRFRLRRKRQ